MKKLRRREELSAMQSGITQVRSFHPQSNYGAPPQTGEVTTPQVTTLPAIDAVEQSPARDLDMRMAPLHMKRNFWWEFLFVGLFVSLFAGVLSQRKEELAAAADVAALAPKALTFVTPVPRVELSTMLSPLLAPAVLK